MKHSTYQKLYLAHLGHFDKNGMLATLHNDPDMFYKDLLIPYIEGDQNHIDWVTDHFTKEFRSGTPRQRLDQTFLAFVLRTASIVKEESYTRMFRKPESFPALLAWTSMLRDIIKCSLSLLYNITWTQEAEVYKLEPTIIKILSVGDGLALRQLMIDLGITLAQNEPYVAEKLFGKMVLLNVPQYGSFYWRFLHWMAEAVAMRGDDKAIYKKMWRDLLVGPLYRTLRCGVCMIHFKQSINENQEKLDVDENLPEIFFNIHNKTHAFRRESNKFLQLPDYTKEEYKADSEFMRQALSAQ